MKKEDNYITYDMIKKAIKLCRDGEVMPEFIYCPKSYDAGYLKGDKEC